MGWLEDKERILDLEAQVRFLREELKAALVLCEEELTKAPLLGYGVDSAYVERWEQLKDRFDQALELTIP